MKVVFIMGSFNSQRCMKRIDEFDEQGYEIEAYAFDRGKKTKKLPKSVVIQEIGTIDSSSSYKSRLFTLYHGIKGVVDRYKEENVTFYVFGLANAMLFMLQKKVFVFQESDLVQTYMHS